ncbi:hypothetical protein EBB05_15980 [Methylobacterium brachiatum]|nr:hypothetical protein EBB05_15980 [Methylobacterium brachiatum]
MRDPHKGIAGLFQTLIACSVLWAKHDDERGIASAAMNDGALKLADFASTIATLRTERDQLAADLRKAREERDAALELAEQWKATAAAEADIGNERLSTVSNLQTENDMLREIGRAASARWAEAARLALSGNMGRIRRLMSAWDNPIRGSSLTPDPKDAGGTAKGDDHAGA